MDIVANSLSAGKLRTGDVTVRGKNIFDWFQSKLSAAVSFVGVFERLEDAPRENGAVAIVGSKDYIFNKSIQPDGEWQEFGDEGQIGVISKAVSDLSSSLIPQIKNDIQQIQNSIDPFVTSFKVQTTDTYNNTGIYSAERDDSSDPVVIDWGDGTVEEINGNVSQKTHTYESVGEFNVYVTNIKTFAASANDENWYNTASQNRYTLEEVVLGSRITSIDVNAFRGCAGLTSVTIPDSVTSIGNNAFSGCSGLVKIIFKNRQSSQIPTGSPWSAPSTTVIETWNDASQEWVKDQNYISAVPDTYALKIDIPSASAISSEIHLSDYSLTSHDHAGTYLKEVPVDYKTYDATISSLSASGYALSSDVSNSISASINEKMHQLANALSGLFSDPEQPQISSIGFQNIVSCMYNLYVVFNRISQ